MKREDMTTPITQFPPDVLRYIPNVSDMSLPEILAFCRSHRVIYNTVCQSLEFWKALAKRDLVYDEIFLNGLTKEILQRDLQWVYNLPKDDGSISAPEVSRHEIPLQEYFGIRGYGKVGDYGNSSFIIGAIHGKHVDIVRDIVNVIKQHPDSISAQEYNYIFAEAVRSGNSEIFDLINDLPAITDAMRTNVINHLYNGRVPFNSHIYDVILQYSTEHSRVTVLSDILDYKYTENRASAVRYFLDRYPALATNALEQLFNVDEQTDSTLNYINLVLQYANPDQIREAADSIQTVQALNLIRDHLTTDNYDDIIWAKSLYGKDLIPALAPYATNEGVFAAFLDNIFAREGQEPNDLRKETMLAFLPFLKPDQIAFGERILQKIHGLTFDQIREELN